MKRATLVVALALLAAACGDGGTATTTAAPATAAPTTTTAAPTTTTAAPTTTEVTTTTAAPTTTEATTTTSAAPAIVPGEDPEVDAIVLAYTIALDSVTEFEEKAPYIEDSADFEETIAAYKVNGEVMGGVGVMPLSVVIDGDSAVVTYQLLFGGSPSYSPQTGDAIKTADGWKITRAGFCALMTLARVACP